MNTAIEIVMFFVRQSAAMTYHERCGAVGNLGNLFCPASAIKSSLHEDAKPHETCML